MSVTDRQAVRRGSSLERQGRSIEPVMNRCYSCGSFYYEGEYNCPSCEVQQW